MNPYTVPAYLRSHPDPGPVFEIPAWQDRALCAEVDPELWFPEKGGSTRDAKQVCRSCEVRAECLDYALTHEDISRFGIWGGFSERERRRLKHCGTPAADAIAAASKARRQPAAPSPAPARTEHDRHRDREHSRAYRARNRAKIAAITQSREAA